MRIESVRKNANHFYNIKKALSSNQNDKAKVIIKKVVSRVVRLNPSAEKKKNKNK